MLSYIKGSFKLSRWLKKLVTCEDQNYDLPYEYRSILKIDSFADNEKVLVTHRNIPNVKLILPMRVSLSFNLESLEDELYRFESIYSYGPFIASKYRSKRLVCYFSNPLLCGLFNYLISLNNYIEYHFFPDNIQCANILKNLQNRYKNSIIRVNEIEPDLLCRLRIAFNEYEDLYNDERNNDHKVIFFSYEDSFEDICIALDCLDDFYISMPNNKALYYTLVHTYRYQKRMHIVSTSKRYILVKVNRDTTRYITTLAFVNKAKALGKRILLKMGV